MAFTKSSNAFALGRAETVWLDFVLLPRSRGKTKGSNPRGREVREAGISSPIGCCFGGCGEVGCAFSGSRPVDSFAAASVGLSLAILIGEGLAIVIKSYFLVLRLMVTI